MEPINIERPRAAGRRPGAHMQVGVARGAWASVLAEEGVKEPAIEGYAVRWDKAIWHDGQWKMFAPDAFGFLVSQKSVRALIDHDTGLEIGTTRRNLDITSDAHGLAFRLKIEPGRSEIAASMVKSDARVGVSVGMITREFEMRTMAGQAVQYITRADLSEISLVKAGACEQAYAELVDAAEEPPLRAKCAHGSLVGGEAYRDARKTVKRLLASLAQLGDQIGAER